MKNIIRIIIVTLIISSLSSVSFADSIDWEKEQNKKIQQIITDTGEYLLKTNPTPKTGTVGGEWSILGIKKSGISVPHDYYEDYYKSVETLLKENEGMITRNKYTEYSRLIITLTLIGKDVTNVAGYNLFEKITDFDQIIKQGINGPIYCLIALDSHDYQLPNVKNIQNPVTRQKLIDYILQREIENTEGVLGGWNLGGGNIPDADITGMVLQALAKYRNQPEVNQAVIRGIETLNRLENEKGGYTSWGTETSESLVQVITAKSALGIPSESNLSRLLEYYVEGEGFQHILGEGTNILATEQCLYALLAYKSFVKENISLYDLTSVIIGNSEDEQIKVEIDGESISFDQYPVNINGRVLVPMRGIFEAFGAEVTWNGSLRQVTGTGFGKKIILNIDDTKAYINEKVIFLDVPAKIINGRTMVPVRFISESLGTSVDWNQKEKTVEITKVKNE